MKFTYRGIFLLLLALVCVVSACGSDQEKVHQHRTINGDLQETTASTDKLPSFLKGQPEHIRIVYAAAGKETELLQWIPCFCGCGKIAQHASSMNCFVKEVNKDGSVIWDDHGTRCGVCLKIAAESITMKQQGKSLEEIRSYIDKTYETGYAEPTKTPMPI